LRTSNASQENVDEMIVTFAARNGANVNQTARHLAWKKRGLLAPGNFHVKNWSMEPRTSRRTHGARLVLELSATLQWTSTIAATWARSANHRCVNFLVVQRMTLPICGAKVKASVERHSRAMILRTLPDAARGTQAAVEKCRIQAATSWAVHHVPTPAQDQNVRLVQRKQG
jgi:hypothetical protein